MNSNQNNVLLVEDEPLISQMYKIKLESAGFVVDTAFDGEDAVLQIINKKPGLILLDINMPKQNGFYVLEKIKADPALANIPVLMLSNHNEFKDVNKAIEMGAVDYIVKSHHSANDVVEKVKKQFSKI